jgi:hypothetical protein
MSKAFPTIVVDDFYEDPDAVREIALSLSYDVTSSKYPGKRTGELWKEAPDLFHMSCRKLFSLFYDMNSPINWRVSSRFQWIEPYKDPALNTGIIHHDFNVKFAGIIYLTPDIDTGAGTSMYTPKGNVEELKWDYSVGEYHDVLAQFYNSDMDPEIFKQALIEHNSQFEETVTVKNKYNRLVAFDSTQHHAASLNKNYSTTPRLTQVFFIEDITTDVPPPIDRMRNGRTRMD